MSRQQFENEMAEFIDAALVEAEQKIADRYPGAFAGYPEVDSPIGVSRNYHEQRREEYRNALAAGVRWSIWIAEK